MSCCILSLVTVTGQYKYIILYMREWLSGGASPCQGEGRGFDPRLALLVCPKVVRYLVYTNMVHCVTDHYFCVRLTPSRVFVLPKSGPLYVENIPYNAPDNDQNKEYDIYPGRFGIKTTAACAYIIYGSIYDNPCNVNDYKWCKIVIAYSVGKSEFETTECETADSASWTV